MRKIVLATAAIAALAFATPAFAEDKATENAVVGGTAGTVGGATIGFLLGGPVGAVIGGLSGAVVGGTVGLTAANYEYISSNPVDEIQLEADLDVGYVLEQDVTVYPIEGEDRYGYIFADGRVWVVDLETRAVVQSPGYLSQG